MTESTPAGLDFIVHKKDWQQHRFLEAPAPADLAPGQVRFRVDRFAFTANNISYALSGEALGYWRFFPVAADDEGWGRLPTMGMGDVIESTHPDVAEGTRCFGFFPMSRYLVIEPSSASPARIVDGASHRKGLAPVYNEYSPVGGDPNYSASQEDEHMLMRGLFMTSFLAEDLIADNDLFGAGAVLITSASSKTSIALAHVVQRRGRAKAIGLTSTRNLDFVKGLGCYDQVILYEEVSTLPAEAPVVLVDMAGNAEVIGAVHRHFDSNLKHSCRIGATHWDATGDLGDLPGPTPEFFFAPGQIQKRAKDWGPAELQQRLGDAWTAFRDDSAAWLHVQRGYGRDAVERTYVDTLAGRTAPADGHVISLWDDQAAAGGTSA
jgi:hypothetical protein